MINKTSLRYIIFASLALVSGLQAIEKRTPVQQLKKLQEEERDLLYLNPDWPGHKQLVLKAAQTDKFANIKESDALNKKQLNYALALSAEYST